MKQDICKFCLRPITISVLRKKKLLKIENAKKSSIKTKLNGNKPGPKKLRNDEQIFLLRQMGLSLRSIAKKTNLSASTIQNSLRGKK